VPYNLTIIGEDPDEGDVLSFEDDSEFIDIDPVTGEIYFIPGKSEAGEYTITITIRDSRGGETEKSFEFIVETGAKERDALGLGWILSLLALIVVGTLLLLFLLMRRRKKEEVYPPLMYQPQYAPVTIHTQQQQINERQYSVHNTPSEIDRRIVSTERDRTYQTEVSPYITSEEGDYHSSLDSTPPPWDPEENYGDEETDNYEEDDVDDHQKEEIDLVNDFRSAHTQHRPDDGRKYLDDLDSDERMENDYDDEDVPAFQPDWGRVKRRRGR